MNHLQDKYGNWAVVAGAAIGIGKAFSEALARKGMNLIIIDFREKELKALSKSLTEKYDIETKPLSVDLAKNDTIETIMQKVVETNARLLLYVAAFSKVKRFSDQSAEEIEQHLKVNTNSLILLMHAFTKRLIAEKQKGGILIMSSLAGLIGMQYVAPYGATKAFIWNLAEALHHELKPLGIDVTACIAGATATEAYLETDPQYGFIKPQVQMPKEVAELALNNLGKKAIFMSGLSNRINYFILTRLLSRRLAGRLANKTMKGMYPKI